MVDYRLLEQTEDQIKYEYLPGGDLSKKAGIIVFDTMCKGVSMEKPAEKDFECHATEEEINGLRHAINSIRAGNGAPPLPEAELGNIAANAKWYYYANYTAEKLCRMLNNGETPTEGTV